MTTAATTGSVDLDEPELLHLALYAMKADRNDEAMRLLKRTIHDFPGSAHARYLLGAQHAQIGLYDRAVAEMAEAVKLDPSLAAGHFQLGLLHLTAGRLGEAQSAWLPLDRLANDHPLRLFKSALLHLARDEFAQCIEGLKAGIAHNKLNQPLNDDMRRLLADVQKRYPHTDSTNQDGVSTGTPSQVRIPVPTKHMLLSTYDKNPDDTATD